MVTLHPLNGMQCQLNEVTLGKYPENFRDTAGTFPSTASHHRLRPAESAEGDLVESRQCTSTLFFWATLLCMSPPWLSGLQKLHGIKRRALCKQLNRGKALVSSGESSRCLSKKSTFASVKVCNQCGRGRGIWRKCHLCLPGETQASSAGTRCMEKHMSSRPGS